MSDAKYTLQEAQIVLNRQICAISQHKPSAEIVTYGSPLSKWLCNCQLVTYVGTMRTSNEANV